MIGRMFPPQGYGVEDEPYAYYIFIDDDGYIKAKNGRTGRIDFSGSDASTVIQNALNALPNYKEYNDPQTVIAFSNDNFVLNNTVTVLKKVKFINGHFTINAPLAFDVYSGHTGYSNLLHQVQFIDCIFDGVDNTHDAIAFRYVASWQLINVKMFRVKKGVILERTWGHDQLMLNCDIRGIPPSGEGLVTVNTPQNDQTNEVCIYNCVFSPNTNNGSAIHFYPQYSPGDVRLIRLDNVHVEPEGNYAPYVITGYKVFDTVITNLNYVPRTSFSGARIVLNELSHSYIQGILMPPMNFGRALGLKIEATIPGIQSDTPFIDIGSASDVEVNIQEHLFGTILNSDTPLLRFGSPTSEANNVRVRNLFVWYSKMKCVVEFLGGVGRNNVLENCIFKDLNYDNSYSNVYVVITNGAEVAFDNVMIVNKNYFDVINDWNKLRTPVGIVYAGGGVRAKNYGTATISAGSTRVTVSHGLVRTPSIVNITPLALPPGKLWVENITSTSFDIVTDTAPTVDLSVMWYAEI
jgi:hypothetical protein